MCVLFIISNVFNSEWNKKHPGKALYCVALGYVEASVIFIYFLFICESGNSQSLLLLLS